MSKLLFGQQDALTDPSNPKNDLIVLNDTNYSNSGLSIGPGGIFSNLRLAYSIPDSLATIVTDNLQMTTSNLYMSGLSDGTVHNKNYRYMVMDASGKVYQGYAGYQGDLNSTVASIQNDIVLLKQAAGLPVVAPTDYSQMFSYVSIGLNILVIIVIIYLLVRIFHLNRQVKNPYPQGFNQPSNVPYNMPAPPPPSYPAYHQPYPTYAQPVYAAPHPPVYMAPHPTVYSAPQQPSFAQPSSQPTA